MKVREEKVKRAGSDANLTPQPQFSCTMSASADQAQPRVAVRKCGCANGEVVQVLRDLGIHGTVHGSVGFMKTLS